MLQTSSPSLIVAPQARKANSMNNEPSPTLTPYQIAAIREAIAELGRGYQPGFVEMVSSVAYNTVVDYLKNAGMPEEVLDLLGIALVLRNYAGELEAGTISDVGAGDIVDTLPEATRLIWALGGSFTDGDSSWGK